MDCAPPNSVIVIKAPQGPNAVWGGLMSARSKVLGVQGVVIQGRVRDLLEHWDAEFPVFSTGKSTLGTGSFVKVSKIGEPITLGEQVWPVTVHSGDIIVGDLNGVVSIPADLISSVLSLCEQGTQIDNLCMTSIQTGRSLVETFKEFRG